jgi:hypothetical protein
MCLHCPVCPIGDIRVFGVERMHEGGDASTRAVALVQDPKMASLKNNSEAREPLEPGISRGRSGYAQFGIIRTKPGMQPLYELQVVTHFTKLGRADALATLCMSCSDKIAMWSSVGVQGALLVDLGLEPVRLGSIVIGDVQGHENFYGDLELIREDCQRAFGERLQGVVLPDPYWVRIPEVHWTPRRFGGSKCQPMEERTTTNECEAPISVGGGPPLDNPQRSSGQRIPTSMRFWRMASDVVQVQRIAIWNTSGARHLASGVFWFTHCPWLSYVARSCARRPSSCCTIRSQQLKLVHLRTSSPSFSKEPFLRMAFFLPRRPRMYYAAKHGSRAAAYHSAKAALREVDGAPFAGWPVKKHTALDLFTLSQNK